MTKTDWPVKPDDVRAGRPDGTCFYCRAPLGAQHNTGCVIRKKTVVVDITMRLVRSVPEDLDAASIEFQMNGSSWCYNNLLYEIESIHHPEDHTHCLCDRTEGKFIREATTEDEDRYGICNPDHTANESTD